MRNFRTEGIIIKRKNFGEADKILTVLTRKHGKLSIMAKGVRRISSRRSPHIELLNHSMLTLYKGSMSILTEAQTLEDFGEIKEDLKKVGFAYHLCELIDGLCAESQENERVFFLFKDTLVRLSGEENIKDIIHHFERQLLSYLGFSPNIVDEEFNTSSFIERILERKLKTRQLLAHFQ